MQVEVVGLLGRGLENRNRLTPWVLFPLAQVKVVHRGQTGQVARGHSGHPWAPRPVAGKLREVSALGNDINRGHFVAHVFLQGGAGIGHVFTNHVNTFPHDAQCVVVLAHIDAAIAHVLQGAFHIGNLLGRPFPAADQAVALQLNRLEAVTLAQITETLRFDELVIAVEQAIVHARLRRFRVVQKIQVADIAASGGMVGLHNAIAITGKNPGITQVVVDAGLLNVHAFINAGHEELVEAQHLGLHGFLTTGQITLTRRQALTAVLAQAGLDLLAQ